MSDVPIGVLLSGVGFFINLRNTAKIIGGGKRLHSFSIGLDADARML
jgi:hypothetical protein